MKFVIEIEVRFNEQSALTKFSGGTEIFVKADFTV